MTLRDLIKKLMADPYPPDLAPPATGRIAWRESHLLEGIPAEVLDKEVGEPE